MATPFNTRWPIRASDKRSANKMHVASVGRSAFAVQCAIDSQRRGRNVPHGWGLGADGTTASTSGSSAAGPHVGPGGAIAWGETGPPVRLIINGGQGSHPKAMVMMYDTPPHRGKIGAEVLGQDVGL
jgi:hypothetical protein